MYTQYPYFRVIQPQSLAIFDFDLGDLTVLVKFGQNRDLVGLFKSLPLPRKWTNFVEIWLK